MSRLNRPALGAALLPGATPDEGHVDPQQHLPDTWMSDFLDKYADPEVWRGLFSSGAAGRDFTMQHAPKFTLRLDGTQRQMKKQRGKQQGKQQGELRDELGAVLQKRGAGLHTALLVKVHPEVTRPAEAAFPGFLVQYGAAITDMHIEVEMPRGAAVKQQGQHTSILPPPTALPSLRHVSLSFAGGSSATSAKVERLLQDLRAYLHRLPSLKVTDYYPSRKVFAGLFALTQAPNLTRFTTDATIDDQLTELILGQTPNLTHLTVRDAAARPYTNAELKSHAHKVWAVSDLCVTEGADLARLARLPRSAGGTLRVSGGHGHVWTCGALSTQGLHSSILTRLPEWQFDIPHMNIRCNHTLPLADQLTTLHNTLQQLQTLHTAPGSTCVVELVGWHWTRNMLETVSTAVPGLPHLLLGVGLGGWLKNEALTALLRSAPNVRRVSATHLDISTDQHADIPGHWEELRVGTLLHAPTLVRLPKPSADARIVVLCDCVTFHSVTAQAEVDRFTEWFRHAQLGPNTDNCVAMHVFKPYKCEPRDQPQALSIQLALLRAVKLQPRTRVNICVNGWTDTKALKAVLKQGMPDWPDKTVAYAD